MSNLYGNHIVGFPTRRLVYAKLTAMIQEPFVRHVQDIKVCEGWIVKVSQLSLNSSTKMYPLP